MVQRQTLWHSVFFPYLSYVSLFLGMALISGGIVHMPMDPTRYTLLMMVGVVLFGFATFVQDLRSQQNLGKAAIIRSITFSLFLSVGIGMMSGGIQHFTDDMAYAAILIPLGFSLSLFAFVFKHRIQMTLKTTYALILVFFLLVVPLRLSLNYVVVNSEHAGEGGHGHGGRGH